MHVNCKFMSACLMDMVKLKGSHIWTLKATAWPLRGRKLIKTLTVKLSFCTPLVFKDVFCFFVLLRWLSKLYSFIAHETSWSVFGTVFHMLPSLKNSEKNQNVTTGNKLFSLLHYAGMHLQLLVWSHFLKTLISWAFVILNVDGSPVFVSVVYQNFFLLSIEFMFVFL